ncbi:MAG: TlpA family protein disulfide reductase [Gemmatimonadaceae bacterium]|nr:TlpA family protein disulfide reductase [Gemmatimonadaceae bacterium]
MSDRAAPDPPAAPSVPPAAPAPPAPAAPRPAWRRWLSPWNVVTAVVLVWALPRLIPHLGAVVGVRSGESRHPAFAATTIDGQPVSDASLRGKVVLVNFWATWCGPCRVEMPLLEQMYQRHRDRGFVLLGFSVDRAGDQVVRDYVRSRGVTYPVAVVGAREEGAFGGVRGYPTSFLLGRDGVVRHAVIGPLAPASLELAVRRLLDEAPPNAP